MPRAGEAKLRVLADVPGIVVTRRRVRQVRVIPLSGRGAGGFS
jgi:predicted deacylase